MEKEKFKYRKNVKTGRVWYVSEWGKYDTRNRREYEREKRSG